MTAAAHLLVAVHILVLQQFIYFYCSWQRTWPRTFCKKAGLARWGQRMSLSSDAGLLLIAGSLCTLRSHWYVSRLHRGAHSCMHKCTLHYLNYSTYLYICKKAIEKLSTVRSFPHWKFFPLLPKDCFTCWRGSWSKKNQIFRFHSQSQKCRR